MFECTISPNRRKISRESVGRKITKGKKENVNGENGRRREEERLTRRKDF